jgi:sRNA-binding protein
VDIRDLVRTGQVGGIIAALAEFFPACFAVYQYRRRPLKVGIHDDIAVALKGAITTKEISIALKVYASNIGYLRACREDAERIDLAGQVAGYVTADEAARAAERLARRKRPMSKPPSVTDRSSRIGRIETRASLATLKAAAVARRERVAP